MSIKKKIRIVTVPVKSPGKGKKWTCKHCQHFKYLNTFPENLTQIKFSKV